MHTRRAETAEQIAERIAEFGRTKNPEALWPGLGERARVAACRELERVTRLVLSGHTGVALDASADHSPYALGIAGHTSGMGPVVGRWLEDGRVSTRTEMAAVFAEHLAQSRRRGARMEREVQPAVDALRNRGVVPVALKGFHTGRVYFDEPGARRMADVDLLVRPEQVPDAEAALREAGFIAETAALRPYKRDWVPASADPRLHSIELSHERSKWVLELHASLDRVHHPGATARLDGERGNVETLKIGATELQVLSPALLVVYLACHGSQELDGIRLLRVFELASVIRRERDRGRLDWARVLELLRRTHTARFAYPALALANDLLPGIVDERVLELGWRESTWAARHTVVRLTPAGGSLDERSVVRELMWTRGPVSVATRLLRNVWPASFASPRDVIPGWRVRVRRLMSGGLSLEAPNERE